MTTKTIIPGDRVQWDRQYLKRIDQERKDTIRQRGTVMSVTSTTARVTWDTGITDTHMISHLHLSKR